MAQTCSSIGKDSTPSKPLLSSGDKKDTSSSGKSSPSSHSNNNKSANVSSDDHRSKSVNGSSASSSSSLSDKRSSSSPGGKDSNNKPGFRTIPPKEIPPLVPIASSSPGARSPAPGSSDPKSGGAGERDCTSVTSVIQHPVSTSSSSSSSSSSAGGNQSNSRISLSCGNVLLEVNHQESTSSSSTSGSGHAKTSSSGPYSAGTVLKPDSLSLHAGALPPSLGSYPFLGHNLHVDHLAAAQAYSGLAHSAMGLHKTLPGAHSASAVGAPYVGYARVKTASGATTLVPICRDPYCTNCQVTMQNAHLATAMCGAGCTQCTHDKPTLLPPSSMAGLGAGGALGGILPLASHGAMSSAAAAASGLSSLYPHGLGTLPGHHGMPPYVCNWMAGSDYCGKRFATSEELLQHLRTHTSAADPMLAGGLVSYSSGLAVSPLAGCTSHYSTPGSISPNSLRRAYPTSLSPNSLAASRFHPYKSVLPSLQSAPLPGLPLSSVGAYYPSYSLYGQRLGAAVAP